jgi:hypothetical protein
MPTLPATPATCSTRTADTSDRLNYQEDPMIEALTGFPDNVAAFVCHGHVTKADYEKVLIPDVEKRLAHHDKVRI